MHEPKIRVDHRSSVGSFQSLSDAPIFVMITMPALVGMPSNPDKIEKIFGYNAVIATAIEPQW